VKIPLEKIKPNSFNSNEMSREEYERFKESIIRFGMKDAIKVRRKDSFFEIIDGEHRFKVAKELLWKEIEAKVENCSEDEAKVKNSRYNNRGHLNPVKEFKKWYEHTKSGWTQERIAKEYGVDRTHVSRGISIYLNDVLRENVRMRTITVRDAEELLPLKDKPELLSQVIEDVKKENLFKTSLRDVVRKLKDTSDKTLKESFFQDVPTVHIPDNSSQDSIYCGDCLEIMKEWPDDFVDMIMTSPLIGA